MITVDTNVQAERFKFLELDDPSNEVGLMDPYLQASIDEDTNS